MTSEELDVKEILKNYKNVRIVNGAQLEYNKKYILLVSRKFENLNTFLEYLQNNINSLIFVWKITQYKPSETIKEFVQKNKLFNSFIIVRYATLNEGE